MDANETTSLTPYQKLRRWGYVFSIGLTAVCLIAFLCTCVTKIPIIEEGYNIGTKAIFNPLSLVYLFSCIPSLAFGCLFSVVARIGENVQAMKDAQGGSSNEAVEAGNASQKKGEDFNITFLIVVAVLIVVGVTFVAMMDLLK